MRLLTGEAAEGRLKDVEKDCLIIGSAGLRFRVKWSDVKAVPLRCEQVYDGPAYI